MTTPASGPISINDINAEVATDPWSGVRPGLNYGGMAWIRGFTKTSVGGATNFVQDLNTTHDKAYYKSNGLGNCNNGNCTTGTDCADSNCDKQCVDCYNTSVNCLVYDAGPFLQPNCNCLGGYNCTKNTHKYNCNCDCDCQCDFIVFDCACW